MIRLHDFRVLQENYLILGVEPGPATIENPVSGTRDETRHLASRITTTFPSRRLVRPGLARDWGPPKRPSIKKTQDPR